jgi:ATP-dependent Clp protease ATP-binding subunit ClpA
MGAALRYLGPAAAEARALGCNYIGTEHLLLVLVARPSGPAAAVLERLGVGTDAVRERLLGMFRGADTPTIDPDALATLGIDLAQVRGRIEETFGPGALERAGGGCMGLTPRAKLALACAAEEAPDEPVRDEHVLVGLISVEDSLAARVLTELGVSLSYVRGALEA